MDKIPNITQEELESIERFWQGNFVDGEEAERLRERYANDPLWREKADGLRLLALGIQESELEGRLNVFHRTIVAPRQPGWKGWAKWTVAASMIGVLLAASLFFLSRSPEEKLFDQFYRPDPGLPTFLGVSDHYEFENAMVSYKMGDYGEAVQGWQQLLKSYPQNDTLNYFIGSAQLAEDHIGAAVQSLDQVVAVPGSVFRSDAYWYLALGHLKMKDRDAAIEALRQSEHPDKERLLAELNQ